VVRPRTTVAQAGLPVILAAMPAAESVTAFLNSSQLRFRRAFRHASMPYCALHGHDALELVCHLTGEGEEWAPSGEPAPFTPGTIALHPHGCEHAQRNRAQGEDMCVHIQTPVRLPEDFRRSLFGLQSSDPLVRQQFLVLCQAAPSNAFEDAARNHLARALLAAVMAIAATRTETVDPVGQAQAYLRAHFREVASMEAVADAVGLGPDHLRHLFKKQLGMSMLEYLTLVRMENARELLRHSALSIDEIAHQCGYASHRHLGVLFRRAQGSTPRAFRSQLRRER